MRFDDAMITGFFDELATIQKEAGMWGTIGKGITNAFSRAGQGAKAVVGGIKGAPGALPGMRGQLIGAGLKEMAPAAAMAGGAGLAGYGGYKAVGG